MVKVELKKIGILSLGKIQAIVMAIIGLIMGILYAIGGIALSSVLQINGGIGLALASIIILPIVYGILGFIGGIIGALVFNAAVKVIGGLELDIEE
jgi:hypothetical protein